MRLLERTGTGVQLDGNTAVWLHAVVVGVRLVADSDASCDCFAGDATARSNADWISVAKVAGQDESFIRTTDLTVETGQDGRVRPGRTTLMVARSSPTTSPRAARRRRHA